MIVALSLFAGFLIMGLTFISIRRAPEDIALAPAVGMAASVALAYLLSGATGMSGADSMCWSAGILAVVACVRIVVERSVRPILRAMRANGCYLAPAAVLLIPAASTGVESFFGSVNFDFLSQSQDSWHLAYNSVNNVEPLFQRAIVPLNWSSGSGRFAISMLGAGTHGLLGSDMLRFNSALICAIVAAHSLALSAFVREIYGLRDLRAFTAVAIVLLSAGYTQGYFYYLLGQLSGLPLFVIALIWGKRFFEASEHPAREWLPKAIALAFILNSLFLFYPVLSGFAAAVLGGAAAAELVRTRASAHPRLRPWLVCFSIVTTTFLVVQIIVSDELQILRFWINVISGVQPSDAAAPVTVFTEYVTEQSFALALGLVNYPSSASALARWIEDEVLRI